MPFTAPNAKFVKACGKKYVFGTKKVCNLLKFLQFCVVIAENIILFQTYYVNALTDCCNYGMRLANIETAEEFQCLDNIFKGNMKTNNFFNKFYDIPVSSYATLIYTHIYL